MLDEKFFRKTVDTKQNKLRLDVYLSSVKIPTSRSRLKKLIISGKVTVNGLLITSPHYYVRYKDKIEVEFPKIPVMSLEPEPIDIKIIHEDADFLIVDKPVNLVVHPAKGNRSGTLVNALLYHSKLSKSGSNEFRPGIVHRLDKNTSGLLVVAKNDFSFKSLSEMISSRKIKREYLSLVWGEPSLDNAYVEAPIGRSRIDRKKMAVTSYNSKTAKTYYRKLRSYGSASLLLCTLQTGRTHQIRVHMKYLGHPVVGDEDYGGRSKFPPGVKKKWSYQIEKINKLINRQALHAAYLSFIHPSTGKKVFYKADIPEDFKSVLLYLNEERILNF